MTSPWPNPLFDRYARFVQRVQEKGALDALVKYRERRINEDEMCSVCWPYLGRVAKEVSARFSGDVDRDDLQSELWLIFTSKIIGSFDTTTGPLTPYVMKYASNICMNMLRHRRRMDYHDPEIVELCYGNSLEHSFVINDDAIDKSRAMEKIQEKLANNRLTGYDALMNKDSFIPGFIPPSPENAEVKADIPPNRGVTHGLVNSGKEVHKELRNIRLTLGYSQAMMADCLGIGVPCYASYEYGRTFGVPDRVMDAARAELNLDGGEISQLRARFNVPMGDLVRRWLDMVSPECTYKELSAICGVSLSTVHRWADNKVRPSLAILNRYENNVINCTKILNRYENKISDSSQDGK